MSSIGRLYVAQTAPAFASIVTHPEETVSMPLAEPQQVATLYDSPEGQLGPILFGGHLHWGYWDEASAANDFASASDRLARMMIERAPIGPGERFVDLGCGVGHAGLQLARAKGCFVDGVTISGYQQRTAAASAEAQGMAARARFFQASALELPFADAAYDGGWFFESIFHMGHAAALREASRVLKPGATLLLTDLPTLPHTVEKFHAFADEYIHSSFVAADDYPRLMAEAGFELVRIEDITANVMPWLVPKLREAIERHRDDIAALVTEDAEKAIENWVFLFEYMSENLGYMLVTAKKR
jgi:cyclopropane fatty-acyl-phospholipid synthase-like methyltransferase